MAALIKDFTERHLRKRRKRPEYAERILQRELADWAHRDACTIKPREVIELLDAIAVPRSCTGYHRISRAERCRAGSQILHWYE